MEDKREFLEMHEDYIESLSDTIFTDMLTDEQLAVRIGDDFEDNGEDLMNFQIDWLVEAVRKKEANIEKVRRILMGSKEYEFNGSVLTVRDYYDRQNKFSIDLSKLTQEMLEELKPDEDDEYEEW